MINDDALFNIAKIDVENLVCNPHLLVFVIQNAPQSEVITLEGVLMKYNKLENITPIA
jgi:hypothetical protein